jgi:hypothetical protein
MFLSRLSIAISCVAIAINCFAIGVLSRTDRQIESARHQQSHLVERSDHWTDHKIVAWDGILRNQLDLEDPDPNSVGPLQPYGDCWYFVKPKRASARAETLINAQLARARETARSTDPL